MSRRLILVAALPGSGGDRLVRALVAAGAADLRRVVRRVREIAATLPDRWADPGVPHTGLLDPAAARPALRQGMIDRFADDIAALLRDTPDRVVLAGPDVARLLPLLAAAGERAGFAVAPILLLRRPDVPLPAAAREATDGAPGGLIWQAHVLACLEGAPDLRIVPTRGLDAGGDAALARTLLTPEASDGPADLPTLARIADVAIAPQARALLDLVIGWSTIPPHERAPLLAELRARFDDGALLLGRGRLLPPELVGTPPPPAQGEDFGWRRLIAILALPRSGTTVTTAVFDARADVHAVYEPWNASAGTLDPAAPLDFAAFCRLFARDAGAHEVLVVKETSTSLHYLRRIGELLATAPAQVQRALLVPLRNPFHVFLSEVEARRKWWGEPDLVLDAELFGRWAERTFLSLRHIGELALRHDGVLLSYARFAESPDAVDAATRALGLEPMQAQHAFERHFDARAVRGDQGLAAAASPLTDRSTLAREREFAELRPMLEASPAFAPVARLAALIEALPAISRAGDQAELWAAAHPAVLRAAPPASAATNG